MGIQVANLYRNDGRAGASGGHGRKGRVTVRMRLSQVMRIGGGAVPGDFTEDVSVAPSGMFQGLQSEHGRAFAEGEPIAMSVEGAALRRRERLERIKAREDELTEGIVTACKNALSVAAPKQIPGMANRVGAGGAGVSDDRDRTAETKGVRQIEALPLGLIMQDPGGLISMRERFLDCLPIKGFAEAHAAAGSAEHHGQMVGRRPAGLLPGLVGRHQQQFGGAVHAPKIPRFQVGHGQRVGQVRLSSRLDSLTRNIEKSDRSKRHAPGPKPCRVGFPAKPQSSNDARTGDDDAGWRTSLLGGGKKHNQFRSRCAA
jgi:hypothetical protein